MASTRPRHAIPPLRTFKILRPNYEQVPIELTKWKEMSTGAEGSVTAVPKFIEHFVEAHRVYTDNSGSLCFEMIVEDQSQGQLTSKMPMCMAAGTWKDCEEITADLVTRPTSHLN